MSEYERQLHAALSEWRALLMELVQQVHSLNPGWRVPVRLPIALPPLPNVAPTSAGADSPSPVSPGGGGSVFLTCADCGLNRYQEPTVAVRWDERPRCNSCASKKPLGVSGPPGAAAAKESPDNAAAPEGAALHDVERECNCEQAEELKLRLEQFRAELDKTRIESSDRAKLLRHIARDLGSLLEVIGAELDPA